MTTVSVSTIICTCGHSFDADVIEGIHVSRRPDLREAVLGGTFHLLECPACGRELQIDKLVAYTDFDREHWFAVAPEPAIHQYREWRDKIADSYDSTMVRCAPQIVRETWAPTMRRRLIFGLASLREKLVVFDLDLDDRVIEAMKLHMITEVGVPFEFGTYLHLRSFEANDLVFEYQAVGMIEPQKIPISRAHHDRLASDPSPLQAQYGFLFDEWIVDQRLWHLPDMSVSVAVFVP